jgi:hypothetical protein
MPLRGDKKTKQRYSRQAGPEVVLEHDAARTRLL